MNPDVKLNITQRTSITFKEGCNMSEPRDYMHLKGIQLEKCSNRNAIYMFPRNNAGVHYKRWWELSLEDAVQLRDQLN